MSQLQLSVVLAVYNEENNIGRCLQAVRDIAEEIIIVDGSSEDRTVEIAIKYGAKVITTKNRQMFHTNKQMAIDRATKDWVLQLDADEVVDKNLKQEILKILKSNTMFSAYSISRKNIFLGKWLKKGGQYPDRVIRLFKNGKARLPQKSVHEQMEVDGKVGDLEGHLLHYTAPTFSRYITNANRYTTLTALELKNKNLDLGMGSAIKFTIIKPTFTFLSLFIRHKGFVDGFEGFVFALFSGLHWPIAYMKLWELQKVKS